MKKVLLLILVIVVKGVFAQDSIPKIVLIQSGFVNEIDSTKNYIVVDFPDKTKTELYKSTLIYLNKIYRSPKSVLTTVENESIVINGFTESIRDALYWIVIQMEYNINIQFKDGKLKFEPIITELREVVSSDKKNKIYIANTDSPEVSEINTIWMASRKNEGYFLFNEELKLNIDKWMNNYVSSLVVELNKDDW